MSLQELTIAAAAYVDLIEEESTQRINEVYDNVSGE